MKNAIILGSNSDIAKAITPMLELDGYKVHSWSRNQPIPKGTWDLLIITIGVVAPVGHWWEVDTNQWEECIDSNLTKPFSLLRHLWDYRSLESTVIWFAGSNPQKIMSGYSAYNTSKMAVLKLVEQLDYETPDCKFIAFGPGYVRDSKIHKATLDANWPNERIARGDAGTSMEDIYQSMMYCVKASKEDVGGRNICVSDLGGNYTMPFMFTADSTFFKLRRVQ